MYRTHGDSGSREYHIWEAMLNRCRNPHDSNYRNYGGRGITVCKRWWKFENFLADMGRRPSAAHTLDRRHNNRGYSPTNCEWVTRKEQQNNTRTNRWLTHKGMTKTVAQWADHLGVNQNTLRGRLKLGWAAERALTEVVTCKRS